MNEAELYRQEILRDGGASDCCENTNRELYREPDQTGCGDYYSPSIFVTAQGSIGIDVGGMVFVKRLQDWHTLALDAWGHGLETSTK